MKCPACNKRLKFNKKRIPFLSVEFFKSLIYVFGTEDSGTCSQCAVKLVGIKSSRVAQNLVYHILMSTSIIYLTTFFLYRQFINIVGAILIPFYVLEKEMPAFEKWFSGSALGKLSGTTANMATGLYYMWNVP